MTDRLPCKNPECANRILPETAARTQGFCMPCVNARKKQEYDDYIRLNRKTINVFPTDELYLRLTADQASDMAAYATSCECCGTR